VFNINLNCSKTNGRNSRTNVVSCSLTDQGLMWLFAIETIRCETIRLKHATLLAKLSINADNTSWGTAWMKWKGAAFMQKSTNSDETFWEDCLHEVLPKQIETYLVKTWSTRSASRNGVLCNNTMFVTTRLTLWLVVMRSQVEGSQF